MDLVESVGFLVSLSAWWTSQGERVKPSLKTQVETVAWDSCGILCSLFWKLFATGRNKFVGEGCFGEWPKRY